MIVAAARLARCISGAAAIAILASSAASASAAAHKIVLAPDIKEVWVATSGEAMECKSYRTLKDMVECPKFRLVSPSRQVPLIRNVVYIVRMANSEFRRGK